MATFTRQPFGELGSSRLQALQSAKNKQNAISPSFATPLKPSPLASTGKRQRVPDIFEDDSAENIDPSLFCSPTKKSKTFNDAGFIKPAASFALFTSPSKPSSSSSISTSTTATPIIPSIRKSLSSPNTAKSTPISTSRGSPKNKRVHAISKRRASSSPFRRIDPPSYSTTSTPSNSLPFSIDAALSGSIPSYTPKPASVVTPTPQNQQHVSSSSTAAIEDTMPKSWFFEIHEDTPEQEASNLMHHSASILDISSDDDVETKNLNEDSQRGKENIPPPEWVLAQQQARVLSSSSSSSSTLLAGADAADIAVGIETEEPLKRSQPRLRQFIQDAMDEDRKPLGDLPPSEFYGEGCDASSYVTVDVGIEKPSGLSRECDFSIAVDGDGDVEDAVVVGDGVDVAAAAAAVDVEETIIPTPPQNVAVCPDENVSVDTSNLPAKDIIAPLDDTSTSPHETSPIIS
ncbi:hypothetical protein T440DRAFT_421930 [Plenodomus tracheiphilus IPT5]|uniref:Uncharacterized protein n=1 Tax=Plenodomus tracheiphilus IPT5 TaxID=1408161 RepID=A0A6A7B9D2_9PLEO|nr:hypothetical protein T440DRAFT_421930 [Plenodomus tracheiphilus IPT5]